MTDRTMPDWRTADEYTLDTTRSLRKSVVVFARFGSSIWPVTYLSRPKHMSVEDFDAFVSALALKVTR